MADGGSSGPSISLTRRPSYKALGDVSATPAAGGAAVWFFCAPPAQEESVEEEPSGHHFLDACSLCKLPLRRNQDIYMCRGNVPFCSEECRQEWMDVDEAREEEERAYHRSISIKAAAAASTPKEQEEQTAAVAEEASRIFRVLPAEAVMAS